MKIIIDKNGNVGFDDWFDEDDVKKFIEALKSKGFEIDNVERSGDEFKSIPALFKKKRYESTSNCKKHLLNLVEC